MRPVLLATCARLPDGDEDAPLLDRALRRRGVDARWASWNAHSVAWDDAVVVLRSTWDYTADRDRFLAWVRQLPAVYNSADVVVWNSDKTYLRDLRDTGVPIVPTAFAAPGDTVELPSSGEFVVKPSVGAGSRGAGRFASDGSAAARAHADALHAAGRTVLVQPYLAEVDTAGETALIYLDGRYSHAVRKGPMLPAGATHALAADELFVGEQIETRTPSAAELEVGETVLAFVRERFGADQLYTRVDLLPSPTGPVVIEVELVEPSLFLADGVSAGAADRLAAAVATRA
jgi:hypothetical protein